MSSRRRFQALCVGAIALIGGALIKPSFGWWIALALFAAGYIASTERIAPWLPRISGERQEDHFSVRLQRGERWGVRVLKRKTQTLIADFHKHQAGVWRTHPDDMEKLNEELRGLTGDERDAAFEAASKRSIERGEQRRFEEERALAIRAEEIAAQFTRRGFDADGLSWTPTPPPDPDSDAVTFRLDHSANVPQRLEELANQL